jgi:hypothetical protein
MDKSILVQYCDIKKEIKNLHNRIEKFNKQGVMTHDVVQNGYKRHLVITGVDVTRSNRIKKYERLLQQFCDKLFDIQISVEEYIQSLEDSRIRRILRYRHVDNLDWVRIAIEMGGNCTADSVRMEHNRFLEKN